jgi:pyruvate,orthophosphate dikinase
MQAAEEELYFILPRQAPADLVVLPPASAVGAKARGLLELTRLGLPVPAAFVLGTALCQEYFARGGELPATAGQMLARGLARLEAATGRQLGSARRPLLLAVRSGAPVSMPGMMETILNIGLGEATLPGLLRMTGNPRLARDCYRRVVRDFCAVVHGAPTAVFDAIVARHCSEGGVASARELDSAALARITEESLEAALIAVGEPFPQSPMEQLRQAVEAVLRSWESDKARRYRRLNHIDDRSGTAVIIQAMVFGNAGASSGAGVGFTRDPATGENRLYLDFLFNAQGEDVVAGRQDADDAVSLAHRLPHIAAELERIKQVLEIDRRDMQDFELTVEDGRLYLLQTRSAKRTPWAALRIAVDLVREGRITPAEALTQLEGIDVERIERTVLQPGCGAVPIASATSASLGVAAGRLVFDARRAAVLARENHALILARPDIQTSDIEGIAAAGGVLTATGGRTAHAAVVARQLGKVCLVGCHALRIDPDGRSCLLGERRLVEGEEVTLDGDSGRVYAGRLPVVRQGAEAELAEVARWRAGSRV